MIKAFAAFVVVALFGFGATVALLVGNALRGVMPCPRCRESNRRKA